MNWCHKNKETFRRLRLCHICNTSAEIVIKCLKVQYHRVENTVKYIRALSLDFPARKVWILIKIRYSDNNRNRLKRWMKFKSFVQFKGLFTKFLLFNHFKMEVRGWLMSINTRKPLSAFPRKMWDSYVCVDGF